MKITNLDSLNNEDQKIILDGREWIIPGELPVDIVLRLIGLQQQLENNPWRYPLSAAWRFQTHAGIHSLPSGHDAVRAPSGKTPCLSDADLWPWPERSGVDAHRFSTL